MYAQLMADYGWDVMTADGARSHLRAVECPRVNLTVRAYWYAVVRRCPEAADWHGDLITVAHNRLTPAQWAPRVLDWIDYWVQVSPESADRGMGSPYVPCVEWVWRAWYLGVPAWQARALWVPRSADEPAGGEYVQLPRRGRLTRAGRERVLRMARAAARTSTRGLAIDAHALEMLGRLSPELQRAALDGVIARSDAPGRARLGGTPLRARHLNWARAAGVQRQIAADSTGRVRAAWATGRRQASLLGIACTKAGAESVKALLPDGPYRDVLALAHPRRDGRRVVGLRPDQIAARLVRGEAPRDIAEVMAPGVGLTRREAHRWMCESPTEDPLVWLTGSAEAVRVRDPEVRAWCADLVRRGRWRLMTRTRQMRVRGQAYEFRFVARLEELAPADVAGGATPDVAMRRAAERHAGVDRIREDDRVISTAPEAWPPLPKGMRLLNTGRALSQRGETERHCVATRYSTVHAGRAWIVSIDTPGARSTVELTRDRGVVEHRGPANSAPAPECIALLDAWLEQAEEAEEKKAS